MNPTYSDYQADEKNIPDDSNSFIPPWERRNELGILPAIIDTWKLSLFAPSTFFKRIMTDGNYFSPLLYAIIINIIASILAAAVQFAMPFTNPLSDLLSSMDSSAIAPSMNLFFVLGMVIFVPFTTAMGVFLGAGIVHLFLFMFGGAKRGFEASFKVVCYSTGPALFVIVPFLGSIVAFLWSLVLEIVGLQSAHETETWRSLLAVVLPGLLCCCAVFGSIALGLYLANTSLGL